MGVNFSVLKYQTPTDIGKAMITLPDNVIAELVRHIPLILDALPPKSEIKSLRTLNAMRITQINLNKLSNKLDNERKQRNQNNPHQ